VNNNEPQRPDPDALLAEAAKAGRGRLKVYLGMAPGVGKTSEMLTAAARRKAEGLDVVVGLAETHGRAETAALLEGLEVLPRRIIPHRDRELLEFDLDAALARRPDLLLVDEYAHSNAPGSRHPKRWQDVNELLAAGIDVWTTLNVQHLESLVDVVQRITGVLQRETVPDSSLSAADEIELIDITPQELRERLAQGKVYLPDTARLAADRFFRPENLTALRELALRRAAETVDDQLVGEMRRQGITGPWAAGERILVLIGADANASKLVRSGRRISDMIGDAPWTVAHVERPSHPVLSPLAIDRRAEALRLAEQLGAATTILSGEDMVATVVDHVRRQNITQIILGRPRPRSLLTLWRASLPLALMRAGPEAALHLVSDTASEPASGKEPRPVLQRDWRGPAAAIGSVALAYAAASMVDQFSHGANLAMIFLVSVLATGLGFGRWPAVLAAALAAFTYNFFFLEPRLSIAIGNPADLFTFAVFFGVALVTGGLAGRVRDQAAAAARRASAVTALLVASRSLSAVADRQDAARTLAEQTAAAASAASVVLLPSQDELEVSAGSPVKPMLDPTAMIAARWAWEKGEPAGGGTGTLPQLGWTFFPLQGLKSRAGVAGVETARLRHGSEEERLLLALLGQGAVALERAELAAGAVEHETLKRSDRLRAALMNSISHDLRTPLSTVLGAATTLIDYGAALSGAVTQDLYQSIREEAERLNRYVGNLLDMTRLEGGGLKTRQEWTDLRDVIASAIDRVARRAPERQFKRDFPAELSSVLTDPGLLEQALVNILENAVAYSPPAEPIEVAAYEDRNNVLISIEDEGQGIPTAELDRVFDKFRRLDASSDRGKGVGLGLSISKGFVEAMGGRIAAASPVHNTPPTGPHGTRILISLPKQIATHPNLL
jgi:two-component system sensor histidine kinase KdpD